MTPVAGLLLAAGAGRRMGTPKALVELDGSYLVERGVALLRAAGCAPVVVVLGASADQVLASADLSAAAVVVHPGWEQGMASSLRAGLAALDGVPAAVVALVDQPLVGVQAIALLIGAWRGGARAAVASYGGQPRNPVLLDAGMFAAVAGGALGDDGARAVLRAALADPASGVVAVPCDGTGSPADVDTPEDLAALSARP